VSLTVRITDTANGNPAPLVPVDDAGVHVIAVSKQLDWHEHVHPRDAGDSTFPVTVSFPHDGEYVFFIQFRPAGDEVQTQRLLLSVGRSTTPSTVLSLTPRRRAIGSYRVARATLPNALRANIWSSLTFHVTRNGKAVGNIDARSVSGHLTIVSEGAGELVDSHSTAEEATGGIRAGAHAPLHPPVGDDVHARAPVGPDVTFHARFPRPGHYRVWTDFLAGKDRLRTDFVVRVEQ
jgi:hypothetical protein